ncbi:hypothetical protein BKA62DRAFT_674486 [Auriculariales sp. MPI-PUGE-AT-0066]|nr:hypothetical protein BKA62DRAFT_674486 [Auriculariales sp. MPI-PUGE-AT-0066]
MPDMFITREWGIVCCRPHTRTVRTAEDQPHTYHPDLDDTGLRNSQRVGEADRALWIGYFVILQLARYLDGQDICRAEGWGICPGTEIGSTLDVPEGYRTDYIGCIEYDGIGRWNRRATGVTRLNIIISRIQGAGLEKAFGSNLVQPAVRIVRASCPSIRSSDALFSNPQTSVVQLVENDFDVRKDDFHVPVDMGPRVTQPVLADW